MRRVSTQPDVPERGFEPRRLDSSCACLSHHGADGRSCLSVALRERESSPPGAGPRALRLHPVSLTQGPFQRQTSQTLLDSSSEPAAQLQMQRWTLPALTLGFCLKTNDCVVMKLGVIGFKS